MKGFFHRNRLFLEPKTNRPAPAPGDKTFRADECAARIAVSEKTFQAPPPRQKCLRRTTGPPAHAVRPRPTPRERTAAARGEAKDRRLHALPLKALLIEIQNVLADTYSLNVINFRELD